MSPKKKITKKRPKQPLLALLLILVATVFVWIPSVKNDFVNWDDIIYVMNCDIIHSFSMGNISKMFSTYWMGNYHPLTILSFAVDYHLFQLTPHGYHFHNMVLHLANTTLVFFFCFQLTDRKTVIAFIAALLFAVHPMHVESVAWISERKDLLYTFWFLLSLVAYLVYIRKKDLKFILLSFFFFLLSLMSKAQAVTLPVVLLVIDYFLQRKFSVKMIAEKLPFFLLSIVFGIIAIYAQKADNSINSVNITGINSFFFGCYGLAMYFVKLVAPVGLSCLYLYPFTVTGAVPFYVYLAPVILILLGVIVWMTWSRKPYVAFGVLFFLVTILPVLQFLPVGEAVMADRYSYIPYIGLFILTGIGFGELKEKIRPEHRTYLLPGAGLCVIILFMILSWNRISIWQNSITLWTDVMDKNPRSVSAYINRGFIYNQDEFKMYDKALQDCNEGLKVDSNEHKLYVNRAVSYNKMGLFDLSFADLNKAIEKNSEDKDSYLERGIMYTDHYNKYDEGIADFRVYLKVHPNHKDAMYNMGVAFYKKQSLDSAIFILNKVIRIHPDYAAAHFLMALICAQQHNYAEAVRFGQQAEALGHAVEPRLLHDWEELAKSK